METVLVGHESPERVPEQRAGHTPALESRSIAAPAIENQALDALAQRAAKTPDPTVAAALRPQAVQRLQLRAGNAAVAAMLQRRAATPARKPAPAVRKPPPASLPVARTTTVGATTPTSEAAAPASETAATETPTTDRSANVSTTGIGHAGAAPPPPDGLPIQRSLASMIEEARRRAAPPAGPEDTKTVEGDTDLSEFTDAPAKAAEERKAIPPPPPPPKPAIPAALTGKVGDKPPPKPPKKKVGKALVAGPKGRPPKGGPGAKSGAAPGEVVKKPAPPLPPTWRKPAPGKPVTDIPAAAAPVTELKPSQDPAFAKVIKAAGLTVKKARKHPTGKKESDSAQGAAVPPGNDIEAQAKAKRADTMATAKPKPFDEEMFVTAVKQELAKTAPKNLSEAGDVGKKAADAKGVIGDKVGTSKEAAAGDVEKKSQEPPNPGDATPKPVTPMAPLEIEKPGGMKASGAMPAPVPNAAIDMREGPAKVDNEMGEAGVTEEQLAKSNEPEFTGALEAKKEGEQHSAEAPGEIRKAEAAVLKQAGSSAAAVEKQTVSQANTSITDAVGKIAGQKNETKSKDELKRKEVSDKINSIFDKTKADVDGILTGLDEKVDREFTAGEAQIRATFTADWKARLGAYKNDRYSGLRGKYRWVRDKFKGLPAKANQLFEVSRRLYEDAMDKLVRRIATIVTQELTRATVRIEQGRGEVAAYVSTLKGDLAKFGQEASEEISEKFGNLDSAVKDKFDDMASSLAKKYAESRDAVNNEIEAEKEKNKGLIDKAIGAVKAVIKVIGQLKDMVLTILAKVADVVGRIIADPIGFLKNFLAAVGRGISRFAENIAEHLKGGLMGWLFGTLGAAGIEVPKEFSLEAILKLVLSVLGVTKDFILKRLEKKIGAPAMKALVDGAGIVKRVVTEGPGVLWEMIVEKFTEFQTMVVDSIKNFITEKVVKAGISWILGLLTPAGAFIKACQAIYSIIMFFVERGSELKEFVESIIDTAGAVARGESGGIPEKIEGVLAKLLPLAISFLASLVGIGGVGNKVRETIEKVQRPIGKALDKVMDGILKVTAPVWQPIKRMYGKGKALVGKAKEKAIAAYEKGKAKVKAAGETVKEYAKKGVNKVKAGVTKVKDAAAKQAGKLIYKGQELYGKGKKKVVETKDKVLALFKRQEKPLSMKGTAHTLIAQPIAKGTGFKILMRSTEEPLSVKVKASIESLKLRAATETPDEQAKTEDQIRQLLFIASTAEKLEKEAAAKGQAVVGPTGAPPGFEEKMRRLGDIIENYGTSTGEKDITRVDTGVQVDMALLQKFGMPIANFLQAQKAVDQHGSMIQIRATNAAAPKELEQGLLPKPESLKMKTVNEDDVLLGVPAVHLSKPALFLPQKPVRESFKSDDDFARATARWKFRTQEYQDIMTVDKNFQAMLIDNQFAFIDTDKIGAADGGVIVDKASKLAFTGDHDLFKIEGNKGQIISDLQKPTFRVQHGAHLDWAEALVKMKDDAKKAHLVGIFNNVIKKHIFGPKGEALLQVNKNAPPTTAHANIDSLLPDVPVDEKAAQPATTVGTAGPHGGTVAGVAGEVRPDDATIPAVTVVEPFKVGGEDHTVTAKTSPDGELDIIVASRPRTLKALRQDILDAISTAEGVSSSPGSKATDVVALLNEVLREEELLKLCLKSHAVKPETVATPGHEKRHIKKADEVAAAIGPGIIKIRKLVYGLMNAFPGGGGQIRRLPKDYDVRNKLYLHRTHGWDDARKAVIARDYPSIIRQIDVAMSLPSREEQASALAGITNCGQPAIDEELVTRVLRGTMTKGMFRDAKWWQVDHRVPLAAHWQLKGFNTSDKERKRAATDPSGLQLIARDENLGAGSLFQDKRYGFDERLGPDFETQLMAGAKYQTPQP